MVAGGGGWVNVAGVIGALVGVLGGWGVFVAAGASVDWIGVFVGI